MLGTVFLLPSYRKMTSTIAKGAFTLIPRPHFLGSEFDKISTRKLINYYDIQKDGNGTPQRDAVPVLKEKSD